MAKRSKIDGWEEIKKIVEEGRVSIPHMGGYATGLYRMGNSQRIYIDDIGEGMREELEEIKEIRWKTARVEAKPKTIDPKSALLEAEAGEDGIFRIEGEGLQEEYIEQIARQIAEAHKGIQEEINRLILGMFDQDDPRYKKYRE